jgi:riboflavin kinase/FMN adenylyltransferase
MYLARLRALGAMSAAARPSTMARRFLEIFLFDFNGDLYGATLDVAFIAFIREELKFDSVEALVRRMDDDSDRLE